MSRDVSSISFSDLKTICGTFENIVKNSFGPRGQSMLMSSSTGHVSLSSDGLTILSSLQLSHPIARIIVKSLDSFVSHNGEGCKSMILYLSHLICAMEREANKNVCDASIPFSETYIRGSLSTSLLSFLSVNLPVIIENLTKSVTLNIEKDLKSLEFGNIIYSIVKTVLDGSVPDENSLNHLSKVIAEYLTGDCVTISDVRHFVHWFSNSVHLIPNQSFLSSHTISGILLTSRLFSRTTLPLCDANFICMQCPVDGSVEKDDSSMVQLSSSESYFCHRHSVLEQFILKLKQLEVCIIISSSKVSDFYLQRFQEANISVIDCVDESDIILICTICKKSPVFSVKDNIKDVNIIKMSLCDKVTNGQKSYAKIILDESCCHLKSFILCAPSQGICQQLKMKVMRCIKVVNCLLKNAIRGQNISLDSPSLMKDLYSNIIPGNGFFEILLCDHLRYYYEKDSNPGIRMCCTLLQKMLLAVPKALNVKNYKLGAIGQRNSSGGNSCTSLDLLMNINCADSFNLFSFGGKHPIENSCYLLNNGVLEVLAVKIALVYSTVSLAAKLIRMDKIIGVRGRIDDGSQGYDSGET